jgi:cytochrome c5
MYSFVNQNYKASFWYGSNGKLASYGSIVTAVTCTTCHDQHSMNIYTNTSGSYSTMFFIRGEYAPTTGGNSVAQFCRNCHGGESNEMHGLKNVPTT